MSFLRKTSIVLGSILALLIVFILCLLEWPSILINSRTLALADHYLNRKAGMPKIHWSQARVDTRHLGLFSNRIAFQFTNLCFDHPDYGHGCFENLSSAFSYGFRKGLPRLTEIGPIDAQAKQLALHAPEKAKRQNTITVPSTSERASRAQLAKTLLAYAKLNSIQVQVDHWTVTLPNLLLAGTYHLGVSPVSSPETGVALASEIKMKAKSHAMAGAFNSDSQIHIQAKNLENRILGPWKAEIALHSHSPKLQARLSSLTTISPGDQKHVNFQVKNNYVSPLGKAEIDLTGWTLPGQEVYGDIRGNFEPTRSQRKSPLDLLSLLQMNRFRLQECHFDYVNPGHEKQDGKINASCFVNSEIVRFRLYGAEQPPIKLWRTLGLSFKADVVLPGPAHSSEPIHGQIALEPRADQSSPLRLGGQLLSSFKIVPARLPVPQELRTHVDLRMAVPKFQMLVKKLTDTPIAVPAPLRTLEGPTEFTMRGDLPLNQTGHLELSLGSHLNHAPDHLNASGDGNVSIEALRALFEKPARLPQVDARLNIALNDIHLTLPKTGISVPPDQVLPDPRIHTGTPKAATAITEHTQHGELAGFRYYLRVTTPADHPIEIASQFMKKPLKVGLDLHLRQGQPWMGFAEINGNKEPVGIPSSQMAGEAAESRTSPKPPFGFSQLMSSFLSGIPFEWVETHPHAEPAVRPEREETQGSSVIELRRRY